MTLKDYIHLPYDSIHIYKDNAVILSHKNIYTNCVIARQGEI